MEEEDMRQRIQLRDLRLTFGCKRCCKHSAGNGEGGGGDADLTPAPAQLLSTRVGPPPLPTLSSTPLQAIDDASGFTRVMEAVRRSNRPAVGHNCWFDVGYVLTACVEPTLPGTWGEYKRLVAEV